MDKMFTETEAAEYLNFSVHKLREDRYNKRGNTITYCKMGRLVRYRKRDLDAFVEANTKEQTHADSTE